MRRLFANRLFAGSATAFAAAVLLAYVLLMSNTRLRVRYHHGIWLPPSASHLNCSGCTASPFALTEGSSRATFALPREDLPMLLNSFRVETYFRGSHPATDGLSAQLNPTEWPGSEAASTVDGTIFGPSPTGRDHVAVEWSVHARSVQVLILTSWN